MRLLHCFIILIKYNHLYHNKFVILNQPSSHIHLYTEIQCNVTHLKTRLGVPSIAGRLLKHVYMIWAYRPILHCITYWVWVHSHWLLRNADKILKYEAEAPLVATDVCDHYQIALGLRRIRNQKLWCTKNCWYIAVFMMTSYLPSF